MAKLAIFRGDSLEREIDLEPRSLRVGRGDQNDIVLPDPAKSVSRFHAELRFEQGRYTIVDLNSQNGTWIAGKRVQQAQVEPGVPVVLGTFRLILVPEPPAAPPPAPEESGEATLIRSEPGPVRLPEPQAAETLIAPGRAVPAAREPAAPASAPTLIVSGAASLPDEQAAAPTLIASRSAAPVPEPPAPVAEAASKEVPVAPPPRPPAAVPVPPPPKPVAPPPVGPPSPPKPVPKPAPPSEPLKPRPAERPVEPPKPVVPPPPPKPVTPPPPPKPAAPRPPEPAKPVAPPPVAAASASRAGGGKGKGKVVVVGGFVLLLLVVLVGAVFFWPMERTPASETAAAAPGGAAPEGAQPTPVNPPPPIVPPASTAPPAQPTPATPTAPPRVDRQERPAVPDTGTPPATRRPGTVPASQAAALRKPAEPAPEPRVRAKDNQTLYSEAKAAMIKGDYLAAIAALDALLKADPKYKDAATMLDTARAGARNAAQLVVDAGSRAEEAGDTLGALQQYERALQLDGSLATATEGIRRVRARMQVEGEDAFKRAKQYDAAGRNADAITLYEKAVQLLPPDHPSSKIAKDRLAQLKGGQA